MKRSIKLAVASAGIGLTALAGGVGLLTASGLEHQIRGTPMASAAEVSIYADEVKAQAVANQEAADMAYLHDLERSLRDNMQMFFDEPVNAFSVPITVSEVRLIKVANNQYEGMAYMQAGDNNPKWIKVHVTSDDVGTMWSIDAGALGPLFQ